MAEFGEQVQLPPDTPAVNGAAMRAVAEKIRSERQRIAASGLLKPWTIINFNPIELTVECALVRYKVPAAGKSQKTVKFKNKHGEVSGSFLTIREAIVRPKIRNVQKPQVEGDDPIAEYEAMTILPVEQAYLFWHEFFKGENPVGGVLCLEGDSHLFSRKIEEVRVPDFVTLADRTRQYFGTPIAFDEVLDDVLHTQRNYCNGILAAAHSMANDEEQARNINNGHRAWADFALRSGWIQQIPAWVFASVDQRDICKGCGAVKKHPNALFCSCGRPYDAFAAFMAGENVPLSYLVTLPAEQLKKVKEEQARRKKLEEELLGKN
jgi:hypothetical protein